MNRQLNQRYSVRRCCWDQFHSWFHPPILRTTLISRQNRLFEIDSNWLIIRNFSEKNDFAASAASIYRFGENCRAGTGGGPADLRPGRVATRVCSIIVRTGKNSAIVQMVLPESFLSTQGPSHLQGYAGARTASVRWFPIRQSMERALVAARPSHQLAGPPAVCHF